MMLEPRTAKALAISAAFHLLVFMLYLRLVILAPATTTDIVGSVDFIMKQRPLEARRLTKWDNMQLALPKQSLVAASLPRSSQMLLSRPLMPQRMVRTPALEDAKNGRLQVKKTLDINLENGRGRQLADSMPSLETKRVQVAQAAPGIKLEEVGARAVIPQALDVGRRRAAPLEAADALNIDEGAAPPPAAGLGKTQLAPHRKKTKDEFGLMGGESYDMEGPLVNRKIVAKAIPKFPSWAREKVLGEAVVSIKIYVTPAGKVMDSMRVMKTSGFADLDRYAMETLRKWVFEPLPAGGQSEKQWGIITVRFEAQ